jgi:hygromycin-B 7''-O-kinase
MTATVYSERLGAISDEQLAAAAARLGLGAFVSAAPIAGGMHGQNLFLTTSAGEFVFRGRPHWVRGPGETAYRRDDRVQFAKEAYFVRRLHEETGAPVPWPYLRDDASDIFGWPYVIMPRLPGECFSERSILAALETGARGQVAASAGALAAEMQRLTSPFAGDFDVDTVELTPDPLGDTARTIAVVRQFAVEAAAMGVTTADDLAWVHTILDEAGGLGDRPATFVHGDYKLDNMTVGPGVAGWGVSGLFDLHTARFGDGAYDLVHQTCAYLDTEPELAKVFIDAWRDGGAGDVDVRPWAPLHLTRNRLGLWLFFSRPGTPPAWSRGRPYRAFAERYLARMLELL